MTITIDITSDFICPWCWIGHTNLKAALALAGQPHVRQHFLPFELNPGMPPEGMHRQAYRTAKFGNWARSQSMDEDVTQAGKLIGLDFHYERIERTPNTRLAHKLIAYTQLQGDSVKSERLFEALFVAYFSHGRNIGDPTVLADLAAANGIDTQAALAYMHSDTADTLLDAALEQARAAGINSVPSLLIGNHRIAGAQTAESMAAILVKLKNHD
jgi:predicted DsbA family dithiol-disulfide isomerase